MVIQKVGAALDRIGLESVRSSPLSVFFILFSVVVIFFASRFPSGDGVGPSFFPIAVSVGIILFAGIDVLTGSETELEISEFDFRPAAAVAAFLVGYVLLMPVLGFLVSTMLFMPVVLYYSNIRSKLLGAALSIGFPIALFYIFARIFLVRLPEGVIPVSRLLPQLPLVVTF
ncbi:MULTISPECIES: tripartite tricarboxylate transporter TctB family protein [Haloferax]|uniref:Tripartite tricarboxylate transporter TctB family protein n=1 Tax=Haloferax massiliensis TaxID=1476858 RepID=A0A0D6JSV9_9EURY|nr:MULTISPECIES: tripartite tricarboxylate transporter TctB family protein [Haloferax]MDS0242106.1 tripartite tricarboxylate transporter TctB family protein [Haloferax sp. S2CR25]MDS0445227.1 tripartite tricarboxylate transporter TctB family protein [Haloferax sp. S2CR25-2]CQR50924.1 Tripartite tricarboxylate transporter TctB family protein [Haloferax massiliensis]